MYHTRHQLEGDQVLRALGEVPTKHFSRGHSLRMFLTASEIAERTVRASIDERREQRRERLREQSSWAIGTGLLGVVAMLGDRMVARRYKQQVPEVLRMLANEGQIEVAPDATFSGEMAPPLDPLSPGLIYRLRVEGSEVSAKST